MPDVNKRSGGTDLHANNIDITGDVAGRDIDKSRHDHYYAPQPRRAELPHQPYFFGREEELAIIVEALDPESNGWGVLIDGPGGIGKTALAIRAGHLAPDRVYPTKIFLSAKIRELTPHGEQKLEDFMLPNYMALLAELARELGDKGIERIDLSERPKEVRRLLEDSHALIIIDNLETFDDKERERVFQFLKRLPRSCKAIVTSRRRADVSAEIIRLDRLKKEDALRLMAKIAERNTRLAQTSHAERIKLYEFAEGNPLLIEWIVGQLGRPDGSCRTIAEAIKFLRNAPESNDPIEYVLGDLVGSLDELELLVLATLSHFLLPARAEWIAKIEDIPRSVIETTLEDLVYRALVISDTRFEEYALSNLIANFILKEYSDVISNTALRLMEHVYYLVQANGGFSNFDGFSTLHIEWPVIAAGLPMFLAEGGPRVQQVCTLLYSFLDYSGRWDERLALELEAEKCAVRANDWFSAGWRVYGAGYIFHRRGQTQELLDCVRRIDSYWANAGNREKAFACRLRGWAYIGVQDYDAAVQAYRESLNLFKSLDPNSTDITLALNSLAAAEIRIGDLESAEMHYWEGYQLAEQLDSRKDLAFLTCNLASLAVKRKKYELAEEMCRKAFLLLESMHIEELYARNCRTYANTLIAQGRRTEALSYAERAVEIYTKLRSPELEEAQAVLKECID